jgi:AbrB family looped-hinge helix DNA binding protein
MEGRVIRGLRRGYQTNRLANLSHLPLASICLTYYAKHIDMSTVTLSPKYQVVIPLAVREALHLSPGEKLRVIRYQDRVELIPVRPLQQMRGFLKGMDTSIEREEDRL